jgi:NAD(P)-dependent dehydrogenase (short-subunit alcohol dehydrogenase family)
MKLPLKKLHDQTIVITGASSGIGLVTARLAAKRGARVVLNARNEDGREHGRYPGHVAKSSLLTEASLHPLIAGSLIAGAGLAAIGWWRSRSRSVLSHGPKTVPS